MCEKNILVVGGLGFIGSHCCIALVEQGFNVTIFDDLSNSFEEVFYRLLKLAGKKQHKLAFIKGNVACVEDIANAFDGRTYDAVVHFAARKYVGESIEKPLLYFDVNIKGTINILKVMERFNCKKLIFSSSATVYGVPQYTPVDEAHPLSAINPYGRTKLFAEDMMRDVANADPEWQIILLRYFNPVGAHASGLLGEHSKGTPSGLMSSIQSVVKGHTPYVPVLGNDWNTVDGTCVRDYIHVVDLAAGHIAAVKKLWCSSPQVGCVTYNLGTGTGTTVLEFINGFERASKLRIPYKYTERRQGDAEAVWASTCKAKKELNWTARHSVHEMCADAWRWMSLNPKGYAAASEQVVVVEE